jgi:hypothetical protein
VFQAAVLAIIFIEAGPDQALGIMERFGLVGLLIKRQDMCISNCAFLNITFPLRYLRQLLKDKVMTLKEAIWQHISGTGTGFELDDVMSSGRYSKDVLDAIYQIHDKYRTNEYPVGISNPECFNELKKVGERFSE